MSLDRILQATVKAGGHEVRLVPGRRIVILTPAGEREVQGPARTPAAIDDLIAPPLTADARRALADGRAEWAVEVPGVGAVRAWVEGRPDGTVASPLPPPRRWTGSSTSSRPTTPRRWTRWAC